VTVDYGRDNDCTTSVKTGRFVTGSRLVAQALYRRLTTPRGMLRGGEEEQNFGLDLTELCGSVRPKLAAAALPAQIRSEALKDERIESVDVDVLIVEDGPIVTFTITINAVTGVGPFTLQLTASAVTVQLLGISEAA
jgi:hypothetical protein